MKGWQKVFESGSSVRAEIVKGILMEKGIISVILNKKETAYQIHGHYELMVSNDQSIEAINLIKNEITF